jgi:hypothetical protein
LKTVGREISSVRTTSTLKNLLERNGLERSRAEQNGMEQNRTEQNDRMGYIAHCM